jgi:hypothetical protein
LANMILEFLLTKDTLFFIMVWACSIITLNFMLSKQIGIAKNLIASCFEVITPTAPSSGRTYAHSRFLTLYCGPVSLNLRRDEPFGAAGIVSE